MKKVRGVVTSDWHLGGNLSNILGTEAISKQIAEVKKIFDYCVMHSIKNFFMLGDLTDRVTIVDDYLIEILRLLFTYEDINFYFLLGNHDIESRSKTSIDLLELLNSNKVFGSSVKLNKKRTGMLIEGIECLFLPYIKSGDYPLPDQKNGKNGRLIFMHDGLKGSFNDNGTKYPVDNTIARQPYDIVFSGHLHTHQTIKDVIIYSGSPYQTKDSESLPKGWLEFEAYYTSSNNLYVDWQFVHNTPSFILKKEVIKSEDDFKKLEKGYIYTLSVERDVRVPLDLNQKYNIHKINNASKITALKEQIDLTSKITPITGLLQYLKRQNLKENDIKWCVNYIKEIIRNL